MGGYGKVIGFEYVAKMAHEIIGFSRGFDYVDSFAARGDNHKNINYNAIYPFFLAFFRFALPQFCVLFGDVFRRFYGQSRFQTFRNMNVFLQKRQTEVPIFSKKMYTLITEG